MIPFGVLGGFHSKVNPWEVMSVTCKFSGAEGTESGVENTFHSNKGVQMFTIEGKTMHHTSTRLHMYTRA